MNINECIERFLSSVKLSRSANTYRTYANAMHLFSDVLSATTWISRQTRLTS